MKDSSLLPYLALALAALLLAGWLGARLPLLGAAVRAVRRRLLARRADERTETDAVWRKP